MTRQDINNINNIEELKCNYRTDLKVLDWFNNFTDYIQETNNNLYNQACKYADDIENEETTDNGYNVEQVKEYYLNSGFPKYLEEPFLSEYSNLDWIEYANETELEL